MVFSGCESVEEKNAAFIRQLNSTDKFITDIQVDTCDMKALTRDEKFLGLESMYKGFDSIQIRIEYGCALEGGRTVILTLTAAKWKSEILESEYNYANSVVQKRGECWIDSISSMTKKITVVTPKADWQVFLARIFALEVFSLPTLENISGFSPLDGDIVDGCGVTIQVATKKIYRIYRYNNPDVFSKKYPEAKKIVDLVRLLNKEFDIKTNWPATIVKS